MKKNSKPVSNPAACRPSFNHAADWKCWKSALQSGLAALGLAAIGIPSAHASTNAWGSINNFDVVNDTSNVCHGFEIEIEDAHSRDITYTYNWNHYGTPKILEDNSNPAHPKVIVRYESARDSNGAWASYTAIPSGPVSPTDGHRFTNPSVNFGGEHFGVGVRAAATNISYYWLLDDGAGTLVRGPSVTIATPTFNYFPPAQGVRAQVQAVIEPPPEPPVREFGTASWVKEIRTTTHNNNQVQLRDLVSDDPDDDDDRNWRNGEPDEVEVEWQLLQTEFSKLNGGANGQLAGAPEDLPNGDEVITRRYEFYKYAGPLDDETGEAKADKVGPDGIHGVGLKIINGVELDLSTLAIVGEYIGAQMSALDVEAPVGLIEHVQDGVMDEAYPTRAIVIAGNAPVTITNWGALPNGISFDPVAGELSGTPTSAGAFQFTVEARVANNQAVRKTYTLTIIEPGIELPPRSTVDTVPAPLDAGTTGGDGTYTNATIATVTAYPAPGFSFASWSENGKVVSASPIYTFTNIVNRSLVANFLPAPSLAAVTAAPDTLTLSWPVTFTGWTLQESTTPHAGGWTNSAAPVNAVGNNNQVTISPLIGRKFFRLSHP